MKKFLSLVLALVMTMSLVTISAGAKDFTDDSKIAYDVAVQVMSEVKVIDGYTDGSFNPSATLTRGAAAKIICNLILGPTTAGALKADTAPYKDVPADSTFAGYIAYCAQAGIISGYADGTFKPGASLTGYAFMKMLLGALGYDKSIEGYEGANWSIAVAKRALSVGLDDGLVADFNGVKAVTREEACLYAFNALQADLVEYDGKTTISVGGTDVTVGGSSAKVVTTTNAVEGNRIVPGVGPNYTLQFGEKYFSKLSRSGVTFDEMGRPSYNWKVSNRLVATESKKPTAVYSTGVEAKQLYKDLDLDTTTTLYYFIDGVADSEFILNNSVINSTSTTKACGSKDGKILEVYIDDNGQDYAVVINPAIVKITSVGTDDDGRFVKTEGGLKYYTEEFAKNDYVEVFKGKDSGNTVITEMKAAEMKTGKVTKIVGSDEYTIDGTEYDRSGSTGKNFATVSKGDTIDFWLDSNGYILRTKIAESSINVSEMAFVLNAGSDRSDWAKLLFTDGTKKTVDTDKNYTAYNTGKIVTFDVDGSEYELQDKTTYYSSSTDYYFTKGTTVIKNNSDLTLVNVDSKTVFVVADPYDSYSAKTYVGYKNAPSFDTADIAYFKRASDSAAALVYVFTANNNVSLSSSDVIFFLPKENGSVYDLTVESDKADYYTVNAIVNGEFKKLDVKAGGAMDTDGVTYYGSNSVKAYKEIKLNSDNQITGGTVVAASKVTYLNNTAAMSKPLSNDVVTLNGVTLAYNDKTNVYFVANDRKSIEVGSVEDILEDTNTSSTGLDPYQSITYIVDDDNVLTNIVLIKNK